MSQSQNLQQNPDGTWSEAVPLEYPYEQEVQKHQAAIPHLITEWIEKGKTILEEKYHELWAECVPIRLDDLYFGEELGACLDIVGPLNKGCTLEEANTIIESQGHSGMSFALVCAMVASFCERGKDFVEYVKSKS